MQLATEVEAGAHADSKSSFDISPSLAEELDDCQNYQQRDEFTDDSCLLDSIRRNQLDGSDVTGLQLQHQQHGRSHSSFRSYTNHHMQSGSNHFVTDDDEHQDGAVAANLPDDCDTCMDRREGASGQPCVQEAPQRLAPVVPYSMRKERLNLDGNLSLDKGASPLLTEPCIQESASWEPSGITVKDKNKKSSRRQITTKNTASKNNRIHQPSNEQIFGLENNHHNASSLRSFALAGNAAN